LAASLLSGRFDTADRKLILILHAEALFLGGAASGPIRACDRKTGIRFAVSCYMQKEKFHLAAADSLPSQRPESLRRRLAMEFHAIRHVRRNDVLLSVQAND